MRAGRQTAGKGRQGRAWQAPEGNLSASTIVRLRPSDPSAATLALVAAVALDEAVRVHAPGLAGLILKWPNDLLVDGAKLSGILLERSGDAVVIGIGVNLAHAAEGLLRETTSLAVHGHDVAPEIFVETLAETFAHWLARWRGEGLAPIRDRWIDRAHPRGTALSAALPDGTMVEGLFDGLDAEGALILRLADGRTQVVNAGDVFLI